MNPDNPNIYHIVHLDRLQSIVKDGFLFSDRIIQQRNSYGTSIGMSKIKERRLNNLLQCRPGLRVGDCVPFYFCPRSVMLYMIWKGNHSELAYRGGQEPIIHLEATMLETLKWAAQHNKQWAFTKSNAGSAYFEDFSDLKQLNQINWDIVSGLKWKTHRDQKQAEFLIEEKFPWGLVTRIGVQTETIKERVRTIVNDRSHQPKLQVLKDWYY